MAWIARNVATIGASSPYLVLQLQMGTAAAQMREERGSVIWNPEWIVQQAPTRLHCMCLLVANRQASAGQRLLTRQQDRDAGQQSDLYRRDGGSGSSPARQAGSRAPPFELEVLEGVLMVATGKLHVAVEWSCLRD